MGRTLVIHTEGKDIEIQVIASMKALEKYRQEFSGDLIRDLNEVHGKLHPDAFMDAVKKSGVKPDQLSQEELASAIMENLDYSMLSDEIDPPLPDGEMLIKALQCVYAMAKAADGSLKKFDLWCDDFGMLPIRELVDSCHEIWAAACTGTVELKN